MAEEKFGIENVEKFLDLGVALKKWYKDANADSKIDTNEYFQGVLKLAKPVQDVIQSGASTIDEAKDLSLDEVKVLEEKYKDSINGNLMGTIVAILNFVVSGVTLFETLTGKKEAPATPE